MNDIVNHLFSMKDEKYRVFTSKLLPGTENIIGVRLPQIKRLAKHISEDDWQSYLQTGGIFYFEEIMLRGMVTGLIKTDIEEKLQLAKEFIPLINNWSVCDSFCSCFKFKAADTKAVHDFIIPYLTSNAEFDVRFALVMLLKYFVNDEYIDETIRLSGEAHHDGYYAKMAQAWALSVCYVKFPEKTEYYLKNCSLDDFTYTKTLQKIIDSRFISEAERDKIREMRRT